MKTEIHDDNRKLAEDTSMTQIKISSKQLVLIQLNHDTMNNFSDITS